ncbi:MAG TPA: DUF6496 domain-containing protein [Gemmatimonadales bacterium]|nr:DUF6496 domain-containing protein [Gemmatimonadales bacterium]
MATRSSSSRKSSGRKYGPKAQKSVERAMRKRKHGTLRRGKSGHGGKVKSRRQAIAIGLSEARKEGDKVPPAPKGSASRRRSRSSSKK